ncbi:hypothetical protein OESDEN_08337 [Oesophagostomum dentatum]|uniref:Reverse transcriptase domain-containing protein n=1 Tax=Oesophagostomum dentatum TaxID=61180 RepID=A0A0B1T7L0_OESDE|nr:hypothetical protein OESDEN_08337 [Oesophagostomum dentatum]
MDDLKIFSTGQDELELAKDGIQRQFEALGLQMNVCNDLTVRQKVDLYNQMVLPRLIYAFSCVIFGVNKLSMLRRRASRSDVEKILAASGIEGGIERTEGATAKARLSKDFVNSWRCKEVASLILHKRRRYTDQINGFCLKDSFLWSFKDWASSIVLKNIWVVKERLLLAQVMLQAGPVFPHASGVCRMRCCPMK